MPRESTIEKNLARFGQQLELETFKFTSPGKRSVPDRLFIAPDGRVLFLEVKRPGEKPTPHQMLMLRRLTKRVACTWTDTLHAGQEILREFAVLKIKPKLRELTKVEDELTYEANPTIQPKRRKPHRPGSKKPVRSKWPAV